VLASSIGAVIVAAGTSQRMNGIDKIWLTIHDLPLIIHTVLPFERCSTIEQIALVVASSRVDMAKDYAQKLGWCKVTVVAGGNRRRDSALLGIHALSNAELLLIHDGARPLVSEQLIQSGIEISGKYGAAAASTPLRETIKGSDSSGIVLSTPERARLYELQTPQVFRRDILLAAHEMLPEQDVADDATLVAACGMPVALFPGNTTNIRVIIPDDLSLLESFWPGPQK
jgi:2-C-methyl-D-erythritol 4-phosphate cytidylyltransferase